MDSAAGCPQCCPGQAKPGVKSGGSSDTRRLEGAGLPSGADRLPAEPAGGGAALLLLAGLWVGEIQTQHLVYPFLFPDRPQSAAVFSTAHPPQPFSPELAGGRAWIQAVGSFCEVRVGRQHKGGDAPARSSGISGVPGGVDGAGTLY